MQNYEIIRLNEDTWSIEDGFVRFFLLMGQEKALMIDSGVDLEHVKELAQTIIDGSAEGGSLSGVAAGEKVVLTEEDFKAAEGKATLPIELLNTHADGDHCYGNKEFDWFYLHEGDREHYRSQYEKGDIVTVEDGEILNLGGRPLQIIHIPGHTFGSIAILDAKNRALFSGDSVQNGRIFMFGSHRNLDEYPASMMKLQEFEEEIDVIYASHAQLSLKPEAIGDCFDACETVLHGEVEPEECTEFGNQLNAYVCDACTFLIDHDRTFMEPDED